MPDKTPNPPEKELVYEPKESSARGFTLGLVGVVCLLAGLGIGLLYTWQIDPVIEYNTHPDQLREEDKRRYVVAIALDYSQHGDLIRASDQLEALGAGDPIQLVADTACYLARNVQDVQAIPYLAAMIREQPNVNLSCNLSLIVNPTATPTVTLEPRPTSTFTPRPPATKTATLSRPPTLSTPTEVQPATEPTEEPNDFQVYFVRQFCNPASSGMLEIYVRDPLQVQIPGAEVQVRWSGTDGQNSRRVFTGLKPDRGEGYVDFQMQEGLTYRVQLPERSAATDRLEPLSCDDEGTLLSYEIIFQERN